MKIGDKIEFTAARILYGNPVKGIVTSLSEEWLEVELLNYIEGVVNAWDIGERKSFRLSLIHGSIKTI